MGIGGKPAAEQVFNMTMNAEWREMVCRSQTLVACGLASA
jgi:hypothetical protein